MELIDRKAVIESVKGALYGKVFIGEEKLVRGIAIAIRDVPTIESRPTGKWKQISPAKIYECSVCGGNVMTGDIECYEYCHHCGAKMEE